MRARTKTSLTLAVIMGILPSTLDAATLLEEKFEATNFSGRGWFDSTNPKISTAQYSEGKASLEMFYPKGAITPATLPTPLRHSFTASDAVYVRYYVKYSDSWTGSNKSYHPHEFYLLTTADDKWTGLSDTHFTAYIEQNEGVLQVGMQDSLNINASKIDVDLTNVTEKRAVAGCNGDPDGISSDCYLAGTYRNGKFYRSSKVNFTDASGPTYKGNWHKVEAFLKFNSVVNGKGQSDGIMQLSIDGAVVVDRKNLIMRTATNSTMRFNSILIGPWIGDGSPVDQTTWIDDLLVADTKPTSLAPPMPPTDLRVNETP